MIVNLRFKRRLVLRDAGPTSATGGITYMVLDLLSKVLSSATRLIPANAQTLWAYLNTVQSSFTQTGDTAYSGTIFGDTVAGSNEITNIPALGGTSLNWQLVTGPGGIPANSFIGNVGLIPPFSIRTYQSEVISSSGDVAGPGVSTVTNVLFPGVVPTVGWMLDQPIAGIPAGSLITSISSTSPYTIDFNAVSTGPVVGGALELGLPANATTTTTATAFATGSAEITNVPAISNLTVTLNNSWRLNPVGPFPVGANVVSVSGGGPYIVRMNVPATQTTVGTSFTWVRSTDVNLPCLFSPGTAGVNVTGAGIYIISRSGFVPFEVRNATVAIYAHAHPTGSTRPKFYAENLAPLTFTLSPVQYNGTPGSTAYEITPIVYGGVTVNGTTQVVGSNLAGYANSPVGVQAQAVNTQNPIPNTVSQQLVTALGLTLTNPTVNQPQGLSDTDASIFVTVTINVDDALINGLGGEPLFTAISPVSRVASTYVWSGTSAASQVCSAANTTITNGIARALAIGIPTPTTPQRTYSGTDTVTAGEFAPTWATTTTGIANAEVYDYGVEASLAALPDPVVLGPGY